ncbi:hypothetical protein ACSBR1_029358 [Camellia fascicularis]
MEKLSGLSHLLMTVFLYNFSTFMVIPAITDVTMSALCPGQNECSLAIYLTGIQQAIMGMGTLVMMPLIGNLSDTYGRKAMLTLPMILTIIPLAILAYNRTKNYYYAYYVLKTLTAMVCEGSVHCLALAYVADNVPESRRVSVFGILTGIGSSAFVCGNLSTRFLSPASTFQVSASVAVIATVYMRIFLPESINVVVENGVSTEANVRLLDEDKGSKKNVRIFKTMPSFDDTVCLLRSSLTFSQAAIVAFFSNLGDVGLHAALLLRSIASKQVGPSEQGKAQGCISGLGSFANVVSPLVFSPLTALFLSASPPFHFPGFSIACAGFALMIAFAQSIMIRAAPPIISSFKVGNGICGEP